MKNRILLLLGLSILGIKSYSVNLTEIPGSIVLTQNEYTYYMNETWNIDVGVNADITFEFLADVEGYGYDYIKIYDIDNAGNAILIECIGKSEQGVGSYSGSRIGTVSTVTGNGKAKVTFESDDCVEGNDGESGLSGFIISYNIMIQQSFTQLGIGTMTPSDILHVEGSTNPAIRLRNSTTSSYLQFGIASGTNNYATGAFAGDAVIRSLGGYDLHLFIPYNGSDSYGRSVSIGSTDHARQFNVFGNGNVTIGTTDYTIDALLAVNGKIAAKEVVIQDPLPADFVFEDDYTLRSLDEVSCFIQKNKHLPEVPSAKAMKENGVGVAEMNQLLLQKVEELTLYLIQQQTEIEGLKKSLKDLSGNK